jgi:hypothetical protein
MVVLYLSNNQTGIMPTKPERVTHRDIDLGLTSFQRHKIHTGTAALIGIFQVDSRGNSRFSNGFDTYYKLNGTACAEQMSKAALGRADRYFI